MDRKSSGRRPNLLFLMVDQFVYHALGCVGGVTHTPNLDRLAEAGVRFERCYTNSPLCMPARAALATGRYPRELGTDDNFGVGLTPGMDTWMARIRDAGYETALFGKAHLNQFRGDMRELAPLTQSYGYQIVDELPGPRTYGMMRSSYYDYLEDRGLLTLYQEDMRRRYEGRVYDSTPTPLKTRDYADVYIADRALEYLERVKTEQPWFCTVGFGGPHDPWDAPAEYKALYQNIIPPLPRTAPVSLNPDRPRGVYDELLNGEYDPGLTEAILEMTPEDVAQLRRSYYGHVTLLDEQIGRLLDCLTRRGMLENTVVVFTSDHGEQNGDYGLLFKQTFFESSVRVPLLLSGPGLSSAVVREPVELMDLGATLCDLFGQGRTLGHACSQLPLIRDGQPQKKQVISQIFGETMLVQDGKKAVFNRAGELYLLFDLDADPEETHNLAAAPGYEAVENTARRAMRQFVWEGVV